MSLSDCEKCWETPCACGLGYRDWTPERLRAQLVMLEAVLDSKLQRVRAYTQLEWWPKDSGALPEPGRKVLVDLGDRGFDIYVRRRVGDLCGKDHPNAAQVVWYEHMFRNCEGESGPARLVRWAYLPEAKR